MSRLEADIIGFMSRESVFQISKFKRYISDRFDVEISEVEDSIRRLEKEGEIFRPQSGRITRLEL